MSRSEPLVTVLTPVYNGEKFLAECVRSVLSQSYGNWEYVIVNNCSSDGSLQLAHSFAQQDRRIRIVDNARFVGVIENHNIAFKELSPQSRYCKVVSADDWIYPHCLESMVALFESRDTLGIVGSYQLSGGGGDWRVKWSGLPYWSSAVSGREICRATLMGGAYVFGCPTSVMYRSELIRGAEQFFPNLTPQADVSAFYHYLRDCDFGFVHQVLCYERIHAESVSSHCSKISTQEPSVLRDLLEYGPLYLDQAELRLCLERALAQYYELVAEGIFHGEEREFWEYHKGSFQELGYPIYGPGLLRPLGRKVADLLFNPLRTAEKLLSRLK